MEELAISSQLPESHLLLAQREQGRQRLLTWQQHRWNEYRCRREFAPTLASLDLRETDILVLLICSVEEQVGASQKMLANQTGVSTAKMSSMVERLGKNGWLTSQRSSIDRRVQHWQLTTKGRQVLELACAAIGEASHDSTDADEAPPKENIQTANPFAPSRPRP